MSPHDVQWQKMRQYFRCRLERHNHYENRTRSKQSHHGLLRLRRARQRSQDSSPGERVTWLLRLSLQARDAGRSKGSRLA